MISKEHATIIQSSALAAVRVLSSILVELKNEMPDGDYEKVKLGVGLSIGKIQMEILEPLYARYPEIDHLCDSA